MPHFRKLVHWINERCWPNLKQKVRESRDSLSTQSGHGFLPGKTTCLYFSNSNSIVFADYNLSTSTSLISSFPSPSLAISVLLFKLFGGDEGNLTQFKSIIGAFLCLISENSKISECSLVCYLGDSNIFTKYKHCPEKWQNMHIKFWIKAC